MKFIEEYKKLLACLVMLIFIIAIQAITGKDLNNWVNNLLDYAIMLLGAGVVKFSVLKTSERDFLRDNTPSDNYDESDPIPPYKYDQ